jgi:hypothetical protein
LKDEQNKNKDKALKVKNKICSSVEVSQDVTYENKSHIEEITNSLTEKILDHYNDRPNNKSNNQPKPATNSMEIESATNEEGFRLTFNFFILV